MERSIQSAHVILFPIARNINDVPRELRPHCNRGGRGHLAPPLSKVLDIVHELSARHSLTAQRPKISQGRRREGVRLPFFLSREQTRRFKRATSSTQGVTAAHKNE